jgi:hypothetical protein
MTTTKKNAAAVLMGQARWAGVPKTERTRIAKMAAHSPGAGRPRLKDRCYCKANSLARAVARAFDCCKKAGAYPFPYTQRAPKLR